MKLRNTLKDLIPPVLLRLVRRKRGRGLRFEGDFASWQEAQRASGGYGNEEIVRRVYDSELRVKSGEAVDARDSVLFSKTQFSFPVMAALTRAAACRNGAIRVADFGGAFGGLYRQYKAFEVPGKVSWVVVEQESYVKLGVSNFQNAELRFVATIEEAIAHGQPDVFLLSSVLQYLSDPYDLICKVVDSGVQHVVIDRTPCSELLRDVLTVQTVPPEIYAASYPCWVFSRERLSAAFSRSYRTLASFTDGTGRWRSSTCNFELAGFILDRLPTSSS